jgi:light-regulated signal transduction histidine kinase (bacteriophytochrome)
MLARGDLTVMPTTSRRASTRTPTDDSHQAARLSEHLQRIHNHDLPNEMVALQSLLQLLSIEEAKNLSGEGQEYLRRLQNAAKRASNLVRLLKEMGRLNSYNCAAEAIDLANLARELQGELQRAWPHKNLTFEWQWGTPTVFGDARVFLHAIVELYKTLFARSTKECLVHASSRRHEDVVEIQFRIQDRSSTRQTRAAEPAAPSQGAAEPLEIVIAREWLALCNAEMEVLPCDATDAAFRITAPCVAEVD